MPRAKTLTALYSTRKAVCDQSLIKQLEGLGVDIVACQDAVGCLRMTIEESAKAFATLRAAHDKVLVYQCQGIMNKPGSKAPAGHPDATKLYTEYVNWLETCHPGMLK